MARAVLILIGSALYVACLGSVPGVFPPGRGGCGRPGPDDRSITAYRALLACDRGRRS